MTDNSNGGGIGKLYEPLKSFRSELKEYYKVIKTFQPEVANINKEIIKASTITSKDNHLLHPIMNESPFHKLCYHSSITTKHLNEYLNEHGNDSVFQIDAIRGMSPLHMLTMNPHAPAESFAALLDSNMEAVYSALDNQDNTPLYFARDNNVGGFVGMITGLCNHRHISRKERRWL